MKKLALALTIAFLGTGCSRSAEERGKSVAEAHCSCLTPATKKFHEVTQGVFENMAPKEQMESMTEYSKANADCSIELAHSLETVIHDYETNEASQREFLFAYQAIMRSCNSEYVTPTPQSQSRQEEPTFDHLRQLVRVWKEAEETRARQKQ